MPDYSRKRKATVRTFAYLFENASRAHRAGVADDQGSFYAFMTAIVFAAFSLEAFLNHVGNTKIPTWRYLDRIPVKQKLELILEEFSLTRTSGVRPMQTVLHLFRLRNKLAHGRTEHLADQTIFRGSMPPDDTTLQAEWETACNGDFTGRALEDVRSIIEDINAAAGLRKHPLAVKAEYEETTGLHNG